MSFLDDIRKTIRYAGRNGLADTFYAARERLRERTGTSYSYEAPALADLEKQRSAYRAALEDANIHLPLISFLVPLYNPDETFLREMLSSVLGQTFGNFEVILADGSDPDGSSSGETGYATTAEKTAASLGDARIHYYRLPRNGGISRNTNAAAEHAAGDYIALLDYDDLLTPDACCEVTKVLMRRQPEIVYTDEDKCDETARHFFEPNIKPDFNADYLLTNNYICHLFVMKRELFLALRLRSEYDGAQDYDLILRAPWSCVCHVPKVLYHWRMHRGSTAGNPDSKNYAYEAGKRALESYLHSCGITADVTEGRHRGFYCVTYHPDIFTARPDVGVVGGKVLNRKNIIIGGMMQEDGTVCFAGMHVMESGPAHRADSVQDAAAVDVRCMQIREELRPLYQTVFNSEYESHIMKKGDRRVLTLQSLEFCRQARNKGYLVVFDPSMTRKME